MAFPVTDIHPTPGLFTPGQLCIFRTSKKVEDAGHRYPAFQSIDTLNELMPGDHGYHLDEGLYVRRRRAGIGLIGRRAST